jgi:hypothetical protein
MPHPMRVLLGACRRSPCSSSPWPPAPGTTATGDDSADTDRTGSRAPPAGRPWSRLMVCGGDIASLRPRPWPCSTPHPGRRTRASTLTWASTGPPCASGCCRTAVAASARPPRGDTRTVAQVSEAASAVACGRADPATGIEQRPTGSGSGHLASAYRFAPCGALDCTQSSIADRPGGVGSEGDRALVAVGAGDLRHAGAGFRIGGIRVADTRRES